MPPTNLLPLLQQLTAAADGLLMPSEADRPFVGYTYSARGKRLPSATALARKLGRPAEVAVETTSFDEFFAPLAGEDTDEASRTGFCRLAETFRALLGPRQVYRVGTTDVDVYVLGVAPGGGVVGLQTSVVET